MILHSGAVSGPLRTLLPRIRALAEFGNVTLLFPWDGSGVALAADAPSLVARYGPAAMPASFGSLLTMPVDSIAELRVLRRAIRAAEPDIVVVATAYLPLAVRAARREGIPVVVYAAELLGVDGRRGLARRAAAALLRSSALRADAIVACSEWVSAQFPTSRELTVIHPGIACVPHSVADLPGASPHVVVVGALSRGRGQDVAVAALPLIRNEFPGATLHIVGEPHPRAADHAFAGELRASATEGTHFAGSVIHVENVLGAADVVVVPNRVEEGFGRVAFEAMAVGTPVIATPLTAAARLLGPEHLRIVGPERPDALAEAVVELVHDPSGVATRATNARRWVSENLDESRLARQFAEVVLAVLGSPATRRGDG